MQGPEIAAQLRSAHEALIGTVNALPPERRTAPANGKWSPAQHLEHIRIGLELTDKALTVPPFLLRWRFGRPNRPGRDYDALVQRYQEKLAAGGRAPSRFVPKNVAVAEIPAMASAIMQYADRIARKASRWSDRRIDRYLVPHPLLGKITLRELFYFTIYHAQHHQALIERDLAAQGRSESPT
ncbi:MAG: DinB family protein [Flavobacteriales bacterium]|nr:DinB family protein [Flavobacteriales bacterium]